MGKKKVSNKLYHPYKEKSFLSKLGSFITDFIPGWNLNTEPYIEEEESSEEEIKIEKVEKIKEIQPVIQPKVIHFNEKVEVPTTIDVIKQMTKKSSIPLPTPIPKKSNILNSAFTTPSKRKRKIDDIENSSLVTPKRVETVPVTPQIYSEKAKKILETLDNLSSPLIDLKKVSTKPLSVRLNSIRKKRELEKEKEKETEEEIPTSSLDISTNFEMNISKNNNIFKRTQKKVEEKKIEISEPPQKIRVKETREISKPYQKQNKSDKKQKVQRKKQDQGEDEEVFDSGVVMNKYDKVPPNPISIETSINFVTSEPENQPKETQFEKPKEGQFSFGDLKESQDTKVESYNFGDTKLMQSFSFEFEKDDEKDKERIKQEEEKRKQEEEEKRKNEEEKRKQEEKEKEEKRKKEEKEREEKRKQEEKEEKEREEKRRKEEKERQEKESDNKPIKDPLEPSDSEKTDPPNTGFSFGDFSFGTTSNFVFGDSKNAFGENKENEDSKKDEPFIFGSSDINIPKETSKPDSFGFVEPTETKIEDLKFEPPGSTFNFGVTINDDGPFSFKGKTDSAPTNFGMDTETQNQGTFGFGSNGFGSSQSTQQTFGNDFLSQPTQQTFGNSFGDNTFQSSQQTFGNTNTFNQFGGSSSQGFDSQPFSTDFGSPQGFNSPQGFGSPTQGNDGNLFQPQKSNNKPMVRGLRRKK